MAHLNGDLLIKVEALRGLMVSRSTGEGSNDAEYVKLRRELLAVPAIKGRLPRFVATSYTLGDFWGTIKPMFPSYQQRREYIRAEFGPLLDYLEAQQTTPADARITVHDRALPAREAAARNGRSPSGGSGGPQRHGGVDPLKPGRSAALSAPPSRAPRPSEERQPIRHGC